MARKRRTSTVLEMARQRLAGLKQINPVPDFGGNLNAAGGQAVITDCADELDSYNQNNAALDEQQNVVDTKEGTAGDWSKRILAAVRKVRQRQQRIRNGRRHPHQRTEEKSPRWRRPQAANALVELTPHERWRPARNLHRAESSQQFVLLCC